MEAGRITPEFAKELLQCFWIKFNNQPAPPKVGVTLEESGTYTDFANINVGGLKIDGTDGVNEVSYMLLDVIDEMKLLQPGSNIQLSKKEPRQVLKRACEVIRKVGSSHRYSMQMRWSKNYSDRASQLRTQGAEVPAAVWKRELLERELYLTGYFNLIKILEVTLNNGIDPRTGKRIGLATGSTSFKSYDDLFNAYKKQLNHFIDIKIRK